MIPYLLAVLGGYLIGDSIGEDIDKKLPQFADGGLSDQLEKVRGQRDSSVINPDELYRKLGEAERNWQKDGGEEYARVQRQIKENRKLYFKKLGEAEMNWHSDDGAEYTRLIDMRDKFADGGMMAKGGKIKVGDIVHLKGSPENRYEVIGEREMFGNKVKSYKVKSLFSDFGGAPKGTELEYSEDQLQKHKTMAQGGTPDDMDEELVYAHLKEIRRTKADVFNLGYSSGEGYIESKTSENKYGNNYLYSEITNGKVTHEWSSR